MSYPTDASGATGTDTGGGLLGLSPLLVMATSVVGALGLAIVAFAAFVTAGALMASIRNRFGEAARWPATMLAIGLCTSTIMLLLRAFAFDLHERIALLVPIVITNGFVLARLDSTPHGRTFAFGNATAAFGAAAALVTVGAVCEAIGHGTLLAGIELLPVTGFPQIRFADSGFLWAAMPPGAFIIAGLLLAARNVRVQHT